MFPCCSTRSSQFAPELRSRVDLVVAALEVVLLGAVEDAGGAAAVFGGGVSAVVGVGPVGAADLERDRRVRARKGSVAHVNLYLEIRS